MLCLKPYSEYKNSGQKWIGRVPSHWEVLPNRALFKERISKGYDYEQMLSVTIKRGVIRQADLLRDTSKKDSSNENKGNYKLVLPGDIAYNKMRAWQGAAGASSFRGIVSPAYIIQTLRGPDNPEFFHYVMRTPAFATEAERWSYGITSDQWSLRASDFKQIYCQRPSQDEQDSIVRFLRHSEKDFNRLIRAKRRVIELLNEQKQAIIQRAVTRGLDPNVRLKPSSIEWLGEIPEHWEVLPVRRLISYITSGSRGWAEFYSDEGDLFIQSGNLGRDMALNLESVQRVQLPPSAEGQRTRILKSDLLICITGALTGNVILVDEDLPCAYVNQHVALFRPIQNHVISKYLCYTLHSKFGAAQLKQGEYGGTKQGLGLDEVKNVLVLLPGIAEQKEIVRELDRDLSQLRASIGRVNTEISLLREYRTRLIADVVTGKLDVRGVELPELDEVEEVSDVVDEELEDSEELEAVEENVDAD